MTKASAFNPQVTAGAIRSPVAIDVVVTLVAFAGSLFLYAHGIGNSAQGARSLDALGVVLAAGATFPLLAWRRAPVATFVVTTSASALAYGLGFAPGPPIGPTVALYFLASSRTEKWPWTRNITATVVGLFIVHCAAVGVARGSFPAVPLLFGALVWGVAWFAGERTRLRRERIAELHERALRAEREVERERKLSVAEERTRIARDLHDSAGHALNVILVQAGASRLLLDQDPGRSRLALETIEELARQTVGEIDQLVRTLRENGSSDEPVEALPGLAALDTLVQSHVSTGLAVTVKTVGSPAILPATVDQAAYRILQESLTNAARHGTGSAEVQLEFASGALEITTTNAIRSGSDSRPAGGGQGLIGIRERAGLLGGSLQVEAADGIFWMRAYLPYARNGR